MTIVLDSLKCTVIMLFTGEILGRNNCGQWKAFRTALGIPQARYTLEHANVLSIGIKPSLKCTYKLSKHHP